MLRKKPAGSLSDDNLIIEHVRRIKQKRKVPSWEQFSFFPELLNHQESRWYRAGLFCVFLGLLLLGIGGFPKFFSKTPEYGGTLTQGFLGYPHYINPLYATLSPLDETLTTLFYRGLVSYDTETNTYAPDLAEQITWSEDKKTATITLRQNLTWHDGEPITAQDVAFTYDAIKNPSYQSPQASLYAGITATAQDTFTVILTGTSPLGDTLLTLGILPAHLWDGISPTYARLSPINMTPVGSGPYVIDHITKDERGLLKSLSLHAREDASFSGYIPTLLIKFFGQESDLLQALQTKRIDVTSDLSYTSAQTLSEDSALRSTPYLLPRYTSLFFNTQRPSLQDVRLRKALATITQREHLLRNAVGELAQARSGFTLPGFLPQEFPIDETAPTPETVFEEAGWSKNEEGLLTKDGSVYTLTLATPDLPEYLRAAEALREAWRAHGISLTIAPFSGEATATVIKEKAYDLILATQEYTLSPNPSAFWSALAIGPTGLNVSQFTTSDLEQALKAFSSQNSEERSLAYTTIGTILHEQAAVIFLWQDVLPVMSTKDLEGISEDTLSEKEDLWKELPQWYKETAWRWHL